MSGSTFERIAIGYNGADGARDALALAQLLSRGAAELTVIRVIRRHELLHELAPAAIERVAGERRERLLAATREAAEALGAAAVTVLADSPAGGLERAAVEHDANLLVVGSSSRGRVGQILAGGVALRLLHGAPFPVALPPAGFRHRDSRLRRVGVGYDGSRAAEAAVDLATRLAEEHDAALEIIGVVSQGYSDPELELIPGEPCEGTQQDALGDRVEAKIRRLPPAVRGSSRVVPGDPVVELNDRADALDCLVVGSRHHGPVGGVLLGSVTSELVLAAPCPLIVSPAADTGDSGSNSD